MSGQIASGFAQIAGRYPGRDEFFGRIARELAGLAAVRRDDRVLDIGCGTGAATIPAALAARHGHVTGIDTSATMLERAQVQARKYHLGNVTFLAADAADPAPVHPQTRQPQPFTGAFDVILASNVLIFLPDPGTALRNWHRLLASAGEVAFSWGMAQDPDWIPVMAAVDSHVPDGVPGFEQWVRRPPFNDPRAVEKLLADCGYRDISTHTRDITTVFKNPRQWWDSCLSSAPYAVSWRHIPDLEAAREDAFAILKGMRVLRRTLQYGFTLARKGA
jgi:SAM-dependent methyltransferase